MDALESWHEEKQSAYLYRILAQTEKGTPREKLFIELAKHAEDQSETWRKTIESSGAQVPQFRPGWRVHFVAFWLRRLGPIPLKTVLAGMKIRGLSVYSHSRHSPHAQTIGAHARPKSVDEIGSRHRIKGSSNSIRASVFGMNDGLVSNASLILGVAAASGDARMILVSGSAGLLAGALSMAAGEYVSVRSQRELLEYQLGLEKAELDQYPEEEAAELALIYEARGIPTDQAWDLSNRLISNPEQALDTLAREELGLDPNDLVSPWGAAFASFLAFSVGALVPLAPFMLSSAPNMLWIAMGFTAITLFGTGVLVSFFSGRGMLWSGLRMLLIGGGAGTITYFIGRLYGG